MSLFARPSDSIVASFHERRAHFRMDCTGIVQVSFFPDSKIYDATLYDFSMGGCGLKIENRALAKQNSIVEMQIRVQGLTLHVNGIIRNILGEGLRIGIEFMDVKPDQSIRIYQLIGELYDKAQGRMSLI
jgi:c-di-GMP-binding flagellar brake protein YcgR